MTFTRPPYGVVDTMVTIPAPKSASRYQYVQASLGQHRVDPSSSPVAHLFRDHLTLPDGQEPVAHTLAQMDRFGIDKGIVDIGFDPAAPVALQTYPDRFVAVMSVDPNHGMTAVREIGRAHREHGIRGVALGPAFYNPQVPIDDRRMYPVYAKCVELDLTVFITVGVPGPRVPLAPQRVELLDEVCWFFPELRIVMRHGGQPWADLAVQLMAKWPNLYYSTSAYAPRYYPSEIIHYANTRGARRILFAGYYAVALSWDRVFDELDRLPLKDEVWPKFLRDNALDVLGVREA